VNEGQDIDQEKPGRVQPVWLVALAGFLILAGFFSVLLRPEQGPGPAGEPPAPATGQMPVPQPSPSPAAVRTALPLAQAAVSAPDVAAPTAAAVPPPLASPMPATPPTAPGIADPGPKVAIMVANLGLAPALARTAISDLPPAVALGFSPYGTGLAALTSGARAKGHEVWVGIPMQPRRYPAIDPGKNSLLLSLSAPENIRRFDWALTQVPGQPAGFYNMMGSAFTANRAALKPVLAAAAARQLLFVDTRSGGDTLGPKLAHEAGLPAALAAGFLDDDPAQLAARLDTLVASAKKSGGAIGLVEPGPRTFAVLKAWSDGLAASGVRLVPVSQIVQQAK
jgi:uncharacterized protein